MRNSMPIRLVVVNALLLSACIQAQAAPAADPFLAAIAQMKRSIGSVICVKPHPEGSHFSPIIDGTAFFVSRRGDFLTAAHVIRDLTTGSMRDCDMELGLAKRGAALGRIDVEFLKVEPAACIADYELDIASCATKDDLTAAAFRNFEPVPVRIDAGEKPDGSPVAVTGYPLMNLLPITSRGYIGGYTTTTRGVSQMVLDRAAWPGGSGSPVYDSRGQVLGIVLAAGEGAASGMSYARSAQMIVRFLTEHPLPAKH